MPELCNVHPYKEKEETEGGIEWHSLRIQAYRFPKVINFNGSESKTDFLLVLKTLWNKRNWQGSVLACCC